MGARVGPVARGDDPQKAHFDTSCSNSCVQLLSLHRNMTWDQPDSCLDRSNSHIVQLNLGMEAKVSMVRHPRLGQMRKSTDKDMETQISTASREESSPIFWRNNILSLLSIHSLQKFWLMPSEYLLLFKLWKIIFLDC